MGHMAHSKFDVPVQTTETTMTNMSTRVVSSKSIRKANLIIQNDTPMSKFTNQNKLTRDLEI